MSPSRAEEGGVVAAEDSEETEDECLDRHFGTDDEDSDDEPPQSPDPTDTKPEPHSRGECVEPPPVDVSPVKTEAGSSDLFVVATHGLERPRDLDLERPSDPDPECALAGVHPPSRDITRSVNGCDETGVVTGSVSGTSSEAPVTAPSSAKEEPVFNDLEEAVAPVPVAARYTHQLFSSGTPMRGVCFSCALFCPRAVEWRKRFPEYPAPASPLCPLSAFLLSPRGGGWAVVVQSRIGPSSVSDGDYLHVTRGRRARPVPWDSFVQECPFFRWSPRRSLLRLSARVRPDASLRSWSPFDTRLHPNGPDPNLCAFA